MDKLGNLQEMLKGAFDDVHSPVQQQNSSSKKKTPRSKTKGVPKTKSRVPKKKKGSGLEQRPALRASSRQNSVVEECVSHLKPILETPPSHKQVLFNH